MFCTCHSHMQNDLPRQPFYHTVSLHRQNARNVWGHCCTPLHKMQVRRSKKRQTGNYVNPVSFPQSYSVTLWLLHVNVSFKSTTVESCTYLSRSKHHRVRWESVPGKCTMCHRDLNIFILNHNSKNSSANKVGVLVAEFPGVGTDYKLRVPEAYTSFFVFFPCWDTFKLLSQLPADTFTNMWSMRMLGWQSRSKTELGLMPVSAFLDSCGVLAWKVYCFSTVSQCPCELGNS